MNLNEQYENTEGKWEFNENVACTFDSMLDRSIPQYELMRNLVTSIGNDILSDADSKSVFDMGCSNGLAIRGLVNKFGATARFLGMDTSTHMIKKAKEAYQGYIDTGIVRFVEGRVQDEFPTDRFSLILSVLTLQFIPIEYRQQIIQSVYDSMYAGGGFILVEKVLGNNAYINNMMVKQYYSLKENNGYSKEEIDRKRLSLEGVLVPVTSNWNIDLLKQAGFTKIDIFWKYLNFTGYIAIK